jgi:hypothetical protein
MLLERNRKGTNVLLLVDRAGGSRSRGDENRQLRLGLLVVRGRGQPFTVLSLKRTFESAVIRDPRV